MAGHISVKKSLGQHWLNDAASLEAMCAAATVSKDDTILEIGPGQGSLTKVLLQKAAQVIAIEKDETLAQSLTKNIQQHKNPHYEDYPHNEGKYGVVSGLSVVGGDVLRFDFRTLPENYKIVANIPYYLTSHLVRLISETANPPVCAALLVQKEVAERAAAAPDSMSLLSVTAQFYWQVSLAEIIPAELFTPPPKVDSQILCLQQRSQPQFSDVEPRQFFQLAKAGFANRRKTLANSLAAGLHLDKPAAAALLARANLDANLRAQNLSLEDWHALYQKHLTS